MFGFSESADLGLSFQREKLKHFLADFEKVQETCENLNDQKTLVDHKNALVFYQAVSGKSF